MKKPNLKVLLRWITLLPFSFLIMILINLFLGIILISIGLNNQIFLDSVSAFVGIFSLTFFTGYFAPAHKIKTTKIVSLAVIILAILSLILGIVGVFTLVKMETPNSIVPILQILGATYAETLIPYFTIKTISPDQLWPKLAGLGAVLTFLGITTSAIGLILGLINVGWTLFSIGIVILGFGFTTWLYPYIHLLLRMLILEKKLSSIFVASKKNSGERDVSK